MTDALIVAGLALLLAPLWLLSPWLFAPVLGAVLLAVAAVRAAGESTPPSTDRGRV